jgi:hypothetical protein
VYFRIPQWHKIDPLSLSRSYSSIDPLADAVRIGWMNNPAM